MGVNGEWRLARFIVKSRDAHGNAVDVLYVVRDITEEKSRELMYQKQLKESMEDAHRANLSKTAFLRRMSHDIRTPLNGIVGMIHIAEKYNNDVVKLRECRKKVRQSADYLQNLINNVLDIDVYKRQGIFQHDDGNGRLQEREIQRRACKRSGEAWKFHRRCHPLPA